MFYPVESLKRGGRFYLCWVADSWPLRFATITHRQLWSQDIRRICDDLLEVMTNESGRPAKRFSLRLSSQLLRGLVRLYQRKVTVFLGDLCMMNANVFKHSNKKWNIHEEETVQEVRRPQLQQLNIQEITEEQPENEQRIEEMIQQSGNIVANVQDITLKEATITENLLPPNDGFGEENPDQALQLLQDRTLEVMLAQGDLSTVHSGLEAVLDVTDKSRDKSRYLQEPAHMERISEHNVTLFRKYDKVREVLDISSSANLNNAFVLAAEIEGTLMPEFEKDIPEIPEILPPEIPVPQPEKPQEELVQEPAPVEEIPVIPAIVEEPAAVVPPPPAPQEPIEIVLEELEANAVQAKRRRVRKLIVDKKTKIETEYFRARIENPLVELRCEDSTQDIVFIQVPPETYFRRPCHGGERIRPNLGFDITGLFVRNLGVVTGQSREERETTVPPQETVRRQSKDTFSRTVLERIEEERTVVQDPIELQIEQPVPVPEVNVTNDILNATEPRRESAVVPMDLDIADMLTQKVETLSQARKRTEEQEAYGSPKRKRVIGYMSFRESQQDKEKSTHIAEVDLGKEVLPADADKENVPANIQIIENIQIHPPDDELMLSSKLQEAGLADIPHIQTVVLEYEQMQTQRLRSASQNKSKRNGSEGTETPLGSLDRTKVSLGDSEQTTDSKRFIRDQWGTEGTMFKILKHIKIGLVPVTVNSLLAKGPVISDYKRIIAARCFTSLLKLKQHGFINIEKNPDTLEIVEVTLGPKLTRSNEQFRSQV